MRPMKIQIRLRESQSDLNPHWVHMSEGTFSDVAAFKRQVYLIQVPFNSSNDFSEQGFICPL